MSLSDVTSRPACHNLVSILVPELFLVLSYILQSYGVSASTALHCHVSKVAAAHIYGSEQCQGVTLSTLAEASLRYASPSLGWQADTDKQLRSCRSETLTWGYQCMTLSGSQPGML